MIKTLDKESFRHPANEDAEIVIEHWEDDRGRQYVSVRAEHVETREGVEVPDWRARDYFFEYLRDHGLEIVVGEYPPRFTHWGTSTEVRPKVKEG